MFTRRWRKSGRSQEFLTGPIHLENNVNLHLEDGAEVLFSTNPKDFYPLVHTSF